MLIVRFVIFITAITTFVLLASYFYTRNQKYFNFLKQLYRYLMWIAIVLALLFLISRVILL